MSAKKVDRRLAVKGDAICFDFLKSDPAVYFGYLAAPGNLSEMFREPSSVIRGIKYHMCPRSSQGDPGFKPDREMDLVGKIVTYGFFTLLWAALLNSLLQLVL